LAAELADLESAKEPEADGVRREAAVGVVVGLGHVAADEHHVLLRVVAGVPADEAVAVVVGWG